MKEQAKIDWHENLCRKLDWQCRVEDCETKPQRVRYRTNPTWGLDRDGSTPLSEEDFLAELHDLVHAGGTEYEPAFKLEQVQALCLPHFEATLRVTVPRGPARETVHERTQRLKAKALAEYGGECADCGQTDAAQLTVCLKDELLASGEPVWVELGVQSWAHKWVRLEELSYPPVCLVRCIACRASRSEQRDNDAKSNLKYAKAPKTAEQKAKSRALREEALTAYGGRCACGQTKTSLLWLVRKPGAEILRYGSGRKLTANQRNARLKKDGWPKTHYVTCQPCWKSSRSGESPDYPESGN